MASIQWLTHKGKRVLLLDFSHRSGQRIGELAREVQQVVTAQNPGSLLVLADFTGTSFTPEAIRQVAEAASADRPYVQRAAWVGTAGLSTEGLEAIQQSSQRTFPRFETREAALEFLTGGGHNQAGATGTVPTSSGS